MTLASEAEIQQAYKGRAIATRYTRERFHNQVHGLLHDRQVAVVQCLIDGRRPERVLEIAPGPGRITSAIRAAAGSLICLEYNEGMIAQGRSVCGGRARWVRGNGFHLPFDRAFDLVYSFRFVRHFHRADRERLYAEIRRVLRPGGYFVMDAINEAVSRPIREASPGEYLIYDKLYRPDELRRELADAGLPVVDVEPVQKRFLWQCRSQVLLGPRCDWLNRVVVRGLERLPSRSPLEWIVTCRCA
jgi:SAM-dependent methyltransferase